MEKATAVATFAGGCFWSKEYFFSQLPGVVSTRVGYTGGQSSHPTYREVCTKTTGQAEAVEVHYDPERTDYESLARYFFEMHDPTIDRRGNGGQYRSAIFYHSQDQQQTAQRLKAELEDMGYRVKTEITAAGPFWEAEQRHQQYCLNKGIEPRSHYKRRWARRQI